MVKKLTTQLEKKRKDKKAEKVVTVKPMKDSKQKKKMPSTKIREKKMTEEEKAWLLGEMNFGEEGYSSKLKAPRLSKRELKKGKKRSSHKVRHQEFSEKEKSKMLGSLDSEETLGKRLKPMQKVKKPTQEPKKKPIAKEKKTKLTSIKPSSLIGELDTSESYSKKLRAPKLSRRELKEEKKQKSAHKIRHEKITEVEQSSLIEEISFEENVSSKLKITKAAKKTSKKEKKVLHPRVRKARVSEGEKSSMIGSINLTEKHSKKLKAPKLSRKELQQEKRKKPPHKVRHKEITEVEQAQLMEDFNFEEKWQLPKSKHRVSRKTKQTAKKAREARRKASKLRVENLGVLEKLKKGKKLEEKVGFDVAEELIQAHKAEVKKDSKKLSKGYSKTKPKDGSKKGTQAPARTKLEEATLHKFQERRKVSETKKIEPERRKRKVREIDLSVQDKKQTISRRKKSKYDALIAQTALLVGELDEHREFKGGCLQKVNEKLYSLQQKAIKIELKVNQCLLKKKQVDIEGFSLQIPEKMSQEIVEGEIFDSPLFEGKSDAKRTLEFEKVGWFGSLQKKTFKRIGVSLFRKNKEMYLPPEALYLKEDQKQVRRAGLYIPFNFLSRSDHFFEVVASRYLTTKGREKNLLFERNSFQELKKNEAKKQQAIKHNIGKRKWVEDYTEEPFYKQKLKSALISLKVIPTPLVHWARRNQKIMKKLYSGFQFMKFPWSQCELKPFKYQSQKVTPLAPTFTDQENSVLYEKPQIPPYWKTIRDKAQYASSSLYHEFLENFGEYDLLNYGKDNWEMVKTLRDRYFENHLSNEELSFQANQEIAPELNRMMKLLNEQPFLVFPLGASPAMYSILPELDGISEELSRHKITPDKRKRVSVKDVHIRSLKGIPVNILSNTENALSFSSDDCLGIEKKEFTKLKKFRDFEVEEYSRSCYSRFSQSMLPNCSRIKQMKELQKFKRRLPIWTFINELFLLDNDGLNPEGSLPFFEKSVLKEDYKRGSFSHSLMYWDREFQKTHRLSSSIRNIKSRSTLIEKLNELNLKLS